MPRSHLALFSYPDGSFSSPESSAQSKHDTLELYSESMGARMDDLLGSKVRIRFVGTLDDGTEFDSSKQRCSCDVFEYVVGSTALLPGFNRAVSEMQHVGEKVTLRIPAAEAYGVYREDLIEEVPVNALPNASQLPIGAYVKIETARGTMRVKVLDIKDGKILFDHNHELAGKDLTYAIELVGFQSALEREHDPAGCACGCNKVKKALGAT